MVVAVTDQVVYVGDQLRIFSVPNARKKRAISTMIPGLPCRARAAAPRRSARPRPSQTTKRPTTVPQSVHHIHRSFITDNRRFPRPVFHMTFATMSSSRRAGGKIIDYAQTKDGDDWQLFCRDHLVAQGPRRRTRRDGPAGGGHRHGRDCGDCGGADRAPLMVCLLVNGLWWRASRWISVLCFDPPRVPQGHVRSHGQRPSGLADRSTATPGLQANLKLRAR